MISKPAFETAKPLYQQVEEHLRGQIQQGILRPKQKIPPTEELACAWGIGNSAVHKAMCRLVADGLVKRTPRFGSFVQSDAEKAIIAILCGPSLLDETAYSYRSVLKFIQSDVIAEKERLWEFKVYDDLKNMAAGPDFKSTSAFKRIAADFRNPRMKGIVEFDPGLSSLLDVERQFERFIVGPQSDFVMDFYGFGRDGVGYFAKKGIKNIVYIKTSGTSADLDGIQAGVKEFALPEPKIYRIHTLKGGQLREQAAHDLILQLSKSLPIVQNGGQIGLLVSDDIVTRGVATALLRQGIKVPDQALVLTWANKEIQHHYGIPVIKYEFSTQDIAAAFLSLLRLKLSGDKLPDLPVIIHGKLEENIA